MKKFLLDPASRLLAAGLVLGLATHLSAAAQTIRGTVFEDVNYGGGAGRDFQTAASSASASGFGSPGVGRPSATVELYDSGGNLVASQPTDAAGRYAFSGQPAGSYTVRVVNSTVSSLRPNPGGVAGLLPVQTFRTVNGSADPNRVGGENPALTDGPANVAGTNNVTLAFQGLTGTTDNTLFLDNVQVLQGGTPLATSPLQNPGFENGTLTDNGGAYQYNPTNGVGWTFTAGAGIQTNNSAFTPPNTPTGTRAGFVQSFPGNPSGSISQTFSLPAGTYTISFAAANRGYGGTQTINVVVNGTTVLANQQASAGGYTTYTTGSFPVAGTSANLSTLAAQSLAPVTVGAADVTGVDFGYSFDVVTNTKDGGQGSLRQFIGNTNALTNGNLAQLNQVPGRETSLFMIPGGAAVPGLSGSVTSGLNGGAGANTWALLALASPLPALTDANTTLDASTQTANVGNSNPGQVGLGGASGQFPSVGTGNVSYGQFERPEVEVYGPNTLLNIINIQPSATNATVRGWALHGAGNGNGTVQVAGARGVLLENNLIGTTALSITDPTLTLPGTAGTYGLLLRGEPLDITVRHNVVAYSNNSGIYIPSGATQPSSSVLIVANELVQNGYRAVGGDNLTIGDQGATGPVRIIGNLIRTANSDGLQFDIGNVGVGGVGYNVVRNNTFFDNGNGGASIARAQLEGAAILYLQRSGGSQGTNPDSIYFNRISQTQATAIVVGYGQRGVIISRNSTYFNGTPFNSPTGGNLGIDLIPNPAYFVNSGNTTGARDYGNGDGVTPNAGSTNAAFGNAGMNYPVFTLATATSSTSNVVNVAGYVGSAPGQAAFAGATVEIFTADNVPANNNGGVVSGDNLSQPHGEGRTYVTTLTCDGSGNFSGQITIPAGAAPLSGSAVTGFLTATAYAPGLGTSEFGPNRPIIVSADVQVTITGSGLTNAGATGSFNVTFSNQTSTGPVRADGVVASVQLPPGLAGVSITGSVTGTYNPVTGLVTYAGYTAGSPGSLNTGQSFSSLISYTQPVAAPVTATASISTTTNEAAQNATNTATATNPTRLLFDVTTAVSGPTAATAGNQVAYVVTSTNVGGPGNPSPAPNVSQTVTVPAGATNIYATGGATVTGSVGAGYLVTWPPLPALAAGQSVSQTVSFTAPGANYSLTAAVSTTPADQLTTNNQAVTATTVSAASGGQANVFVLLAASSADVAPGATGTLTITQGNAGPGPATGVQTSLLLPPGLSNVAVSNGGSYAASGVVTFPVVTSQLPGAASNQTYTVSFTAPAAGGVVPATAQVLTSSPDQVPADNEATALLTVPAGADLVVQLSGPSVATAGQLLTYIVTTSNNGVGLATSLTQTLNLPAGLPITGINPLQINGLNPTSVAGSVAIYGSGITAFTYNATTGLVNFPALLGLAPGGSFQTTVRYLAPANGNQSLAASSAATTSSPDPNAANNVAGIITSLQAAADVQVTLNSAGQIAPGNRLTYGVTTFNNGPSVAPAVATTVNLPSLLPITGPNAVQINGQLPSSTSGGVATYPDGSTYDSNTSAGSSTPGLVTLPPLVSLAPGGANGTTNTISYVLPSGYQGTLTSTATATVTGITDFVPSNNVAIVQPFIVASNGAADLQVTLTAGAGTVAAGSPVSLTLTTTSAGAATSSLLQYVQMPPGLTSGTGTVTVTLGGGATAASYDNQSGLLTLQPVLNLGSGGTLTYAIAISQAPGTGPLVATASASSSELDSNPANNVARATVGITPASTLQTTVSGPLSTPAGATVSYLISSANVGTTPTTGTAQTATVPGGATNVLLNGQPVTPGAGGVVPLPLVSTLLPGASNIVTNTLSFKAPGAAGSSFAVTANLSASGPGAVTPAAASQPTAIANPGPVARNVVNTLQTPTANTAARPLPILPLSAVAQGTASLGSYTVAGLPLASQGTLYLGNGSANTPVTAGQTLTPAQAAQLRFQPAAGFAGNAAFAYYATDNAGSVSNPALYLVPVGPDLNSAYTATPTKPNSATYSNNDVLAFVVDPNGALYTSTGQLYNASTGQLVNGGSGVSNGLPATGTNAVLAASGSGPSQNPTNALPAGVGFNPATGQFFVSDRTQLPTTATTYYLNVITTDLYGGTNVALATFQLGTNPLPVQLTAFTAQAAGSAAQLSWTTASELNSAYFAVERSLDGQHFAQLGRVDGQGNKATASAYAFTDAGAAAYAAGSPVYYRLRQVDRDGTATYSAVRAVSFPAVAGPLGGLAAYPNPLEAGASLTLDLRSLPLGGTYQVLLLDLVGRQVRAATAQGGLAQPLDLGELASGTYLLRLSSSGGQPFFSQRLTKK